MTTIAPYAKSVTGAAIAGLGALGAALTDGAVSPAEWVTVAVATLTASLLVWAVPNVDPAGEHQDDSAQPPRPYTY